jgi:hypothetical protein
MSSERAGTAKIHSQPELLRGFSATIFVIRFRSSVLAA